MHKVERDYIEFAFRLDRNFKGIVDSYFGPKSLLQKVKSEKKTPLKELLNQSQQLLDGIKNSNLENRRKAFIYEQVEALKAFLEQGVYKKYSHKELISKIYQFGFEYADDVFLSQRIKELEKQETPQEKLHGKEFFNHFRSKIAEFKERSKKFFEVPEGDCVEMVEGVVQMVAYMKYLGNFKTEITLNSNFERTKRQIENLTAHETYPGHHLNYCLQEKAHSNDPLFGLFLYHTPNDAIVEGIGVFSPELLGYQKDELTILKWQVRINANLLYYDKKEKRDAVKEYLIGVGKYSPIEAENYLKFMEAQFFDIYYPCYWAGYHVVKDLFEKAKRTSKEKQFLNLLYREYLTPNLLRALCRDL